MKFCSPLSLLIGCMVAAAQDVDGGAIDRLLGAPFEAASYAAGQNGEFKATLVRYPFTGERPKAAILYVHGFNDYFFQRHVAQTLDSAGYAFFAIDLHNYGRSYQKGQVMGHLRHISDYFPELDSAMAYIGRTVGDSVPKVLLGHSTGGLISTLYADARKNEKSVKALVLNSPFLEMNQPWFIREIATPILAKVGRLFPEIPIPRSANDNYGVSLRKDAKGEWEYDTTLKVSGSIPIDLGWGAAIHEGQNDVQAGLNLPSPVLVMYSACSVNEEEWNDDFTRCDAVLDVEHIRKYGANLGPDVRLVQIQGGLHDLYLSQKQAREKAFTATIDFLDGLFGKMDCGPTQH